MQAIAIVNCDRIEGFSDSPQIFSKEGRFECISSQTIQIGPHVEIDPGADVRLEAPVVRIAPPFTAASGSNFRARTPVPDSVRWLEAVNEVRSEGRSCGDQYFAAAQPMRWDERLGRAAHRHSLDMATKDIFSHTGSDGSRHWERIEDEGYDRVGSMENIAAGNADIYSTLGQWIRSDGHCRNLMGDFRDLGIGYAHNSQARWRHYWTMKGANHK